MLKKVWSDWAIWSGLVMSGDLISIYFADIRLVFVVSWASLFYFQLLKKFMKFC